MPLAGDIPSIFPQFSLDFPKIPRVLEWFVVWTWLNGSLTMSCSSMYSQCPALTWEHNGCSTNTHWRNEAFVSVTLYLVFFHAFLSHGPGYSFSMFLAMGQSHSHYIWQKSPVHKTDNWRAVLVVAGVEDQGEGHLRGVPRNWGSQLSSPITDP